MLGVASHHITRAKDSADRGVVLHLQLVQRCLRAEAVVSRRPPRARPHGRHGALGHHPRRPLRDGRPGGPGEAHVAGDGGDGRHGRDRREQSVGEREAVLRVGVEGAGGGALLGRAHGPELGLGRRRGGHVPRERRRRRRARPHPRRRRRVVVVAVTPPRRAPRAGERPARRAAEPVDDIVALGAGAATGGGGGGAGVGGLVRDGDVLVEGRLRADPLLQPAPALVQRVGLVPGHGDGGRPPEAQAQLLVVQGGVLQRAHALERGLLLAPSHGAHLFLGQDAAVPPLVRLLLLLHGNHHSVSHKVHSLPRRAASTGVQLQ